ncbi:hypothetical protein PM10SUCC1_04560 [Propionigenium maris DSM 9537]|uniref:Uncharacterized protein n=1 Tax=Propionigenium maris DSM 9537 TaxID=1123000 RepID=A0A9W6GJE8_9FUSO|nr:hypothetical protein [Propionigenium maris]GLI54941.1 hypothetical protein PM10SUCC1_04560 [Propionigenium maris DSM 9537]
MKKVLLMLMMVVGAVSFGRDFDYNEKRDIVDVNRAQVERLSRYTDTDWSSDKAEIEANFTRYADFHRELDTMDRGESDK